jgi:hypothetical protein
MLRHDVISMEDYVATDAFPLAKCLSDVAGSDIYVGLVGWRYGYIPDRDNPEKQSITALEYAQAGTSDLPRLMFLTDTEAPWPDEFKDSKTGQGDKGRRISTFRADLEQSKLISHFRTPEHLAGLVSVAVQRCLVEKPPVRRSVRKRIVEAKTAALEQRLNALLEDYQAATEQLAYELSAVNRSRIERQIESLENDIERVELDFDSMKG